MNPQGQPNKDRHHARLNRSCHDYPTPRTRSLCGGSGAFGAVQSLYRGGQITKAEAVAMTSSGGQLNPDWVEWLMDWPIGYTDPDVAVLVLWLNPLDDPADLPPDDPGFIPRITHRREYRAPRVKSEGNGQFSMTAAVGFEEGIAVIDRALADMNAILKTPKLKIQES